MHYIDLNKIPNGAVGPKCAIKYHRQSVLDRNYLSRDLGITESAMSKLKQPMTRLPTLKLTINGRLLLQSDRP